MSAQSPAVTGPPPVSYDIPPRGVWWHVYPLGFLGAERTSAEVEGVIHRLPKLVEWLDYSVALGVEGWVLGPVFASGSHGYDTEDHYRVDPRLGDEDDLRVLVEAAHERGLRVVLDGVFNHVGRGFPRFQEAELGGHESTAAQWFRFRQGPDGGWYPDAFEGNDPLVVLNHDNPEVVDYVADVMSHWQDLGVDGWRLDAAYAAPTPFWRAVTDRVRARHPQGWIFGEVIHGDYPAFVAESGVDAVTQYELWKAIPSSLNDGNFFELAHALGRNLQFLDHFVPVTFLGNHDTSRVVSALNDSQLLPQAVAVLFTVGGTPTVYAGDEQGYAGVKYEREGGDDEVRPPMPTHPEQFSTLGADTYRLYRELIAMRRERPWLVSGRTDVTHLTNTAMVLVTRPAGADGEASGGPAVALALNIGPDEVRVPRPAGAWSPLLGADVPLDEDGLTVPGRGWALLALG